MAVRINTGARLPSGADAVGAALRRQRIRATKIAPATGGLQINLFKRKVDQLTVSIFTRQFSVMLDAGLPLVQCLEILGEQEEHKRFREIINQVRNDVESGASLADAMAGVEDPMRWLMRVAPDGSQQLFTQEDLGLPPEACSYVGGKTTNPFDPKRTAGGSSGGSAAAAGCSASGFFFAIMMPLSAV